jgi:hypothetical protein
VLEAPCVRNVTIAYPIRTSDASRIYRVTLPQYRFVADPNAVYRDVPNGRPVFVSLGSAKTTITPRTIVISAVAVPPAEFSPTGTPPPLFGEVAKVLTGAKLASGDPAVEPDNPLWYLPLVGRAGSMRHRSTWPPNTWRALFTVRDGALRIGAINDALETARWRFPAQLSRIDERVVVDLNDPDNNAAWKAADDDSRPPIDPIVQLTRSGDPGAWPRRIASWITYDNPMASFFDPEAEVVFARLPQLSPISATLHVQNTYIGAQPARFRMPAAVVAQARSAFRSVAPAAPDTFMATPLPAAVTMAVDRPELYVIGGASSHAALDSGLSPLAVALLDAAARTRELASFLGVRSGAETLFDAYTREGYDAQAVGVATTFTGGYSPSGKPPAVDPAIRVFSGQDARATIRAPIEIPQPQATIRAIAFAEMPPRTNFLRFEVEADAAQANAHVDAALVAKRLKRLPGVIDAATRTSNGFQIRFEVMTSPSYRSSLRGIADFVRGQYAAFDPTMSFGLEPFIPDCARIFRQMLRATLYENWLTAHRDAAAAHVRLRKLLLVAATPGDQGSCSPLARDPGPLRYTRVEQITAPDRAPMLGISSVMVYRSGD